MGPAAGSRLTAAEGRRFGLEVAVGLAGVAVIAWWRSHELVAQVLATLGAMAMLMALADPRRLGPMRLGWLAFGHALGRVVSPVFFALVYYLVLTPTGIARRTLGRSPLVRDPAARTYWIARAPRNPESARASMERYF